MLNFITDLTENYNDLFEVIRLFIPDTFSSNDNINFSYGKEDNSKIIIAINECVFEYKNKPIYAENTLEYKRLFVRSCKLSLYKALSAYYKRSLPYGSLTGIRPTKLAYELLSAGVSGKNLSENLEKLFLVSKQKADLISDIISNQSGLYRRENGLVNFYVHIPFCTTRCKYCSFVTSTIDKQKKLVEPYIDTLIKEILATAELIDKLGYTVDSVYIGGGTPTSIDDKLFERVLNAIPYRGVEFTCEAGRAETITYEKLNIMKKQGVTRISVNAQTLSDETLRLIGRNHSAQDFYDAYSRALEYDLSINVDLIAGLEKETISDFKKSLDGVIKLLPQNITVHTLSRKRGSILSENDFETNSHIADMVEYAHHTLGKNDYLPYYLYRQKLMSGNLENVGYTKKGFACVNNITTMEECLSVFACGAGAISKRIFYEQNRIERFAQPKDVKLYIDEFDIRLKKKIEFFS